MHLLPYNCVNGMDLIITALRDRVWFRARDIVQNKTSVATDNTVYKHLYRNTRLTIVQVRDNVKSGL